MRLRRRGPRLGCAALLMAAIGCRESPSGIPDRAAGWREDLATLEAEVLRVHPILSVDSGFAGFRVALKALRDKSESVSDAAMVAEIQRVLVSVGDAHTSVIPEDVGPLRFLALMVDFYVFDDGVYVVSTRPGYGSLQGGRVTAIGGVPIDDLLIRLAPYVPRDNVQSARWFAAQLLQYSSLLRELGASGSDGGTLVEVAFSGGVTRSAMVPSHDRAALQRLWPPGGETAATPRYLRRRDASYWLDSLPGDSTLYVLFQSVQDDPAESLATFAARVQLLLQSGRFSSVIVDIRQNNGGNGFLLPPLVDALVAFDAATASHRTFVVIGRGTFSAGQNFATRLERRTRAVFVGEATGSRPNHVGDGFEVILPNSGLKISIASTWHRESTVDDSRDAIVPDVVIPVTASAYFTNADPAMDAVLALVRHAVGRASR